MPESEIASITRVPKPYLAKIIHHLSCQGIVSTKRGPGGGLCLIRPAQEISILEIVKAIEGEQWFSNCMLGMDCCAASQYCPFADFWSEIHKKMETKLQETKLADVIRFRRRASPAEQVI